MRRAQAAEDDTRRLNADRPVRPGAAATTEELLAAGAEQRAHDRAVDEAAARLSAARRDYERARGDYEDAAQRAAAILRDGRGDDGLKDSWWDRNAGWIKTALAVIGAIVVVLALVAIVLTMFVPGLNVLVGGLLLSTLLNGIGFGLGTLMLAGHTALWLTDNGEFSDVLWDLAGLATFGLGFAVARVARGLSGAMSRTGSGIAAARGGRGAFSSRGLPGLIYDVGRQVPLARPVLSLSPKLRDAFRAADAAASSRGSAVATLTGTPTTLINRVVALGDVELAELGTLVARINQAVPGSARLQALSALFRVVEVGGSSLPQAGLLVQGGVDTYGNLVTEPQEERQDLQDRTQILDQWSMPLMHVR